MDEKCVRAGTGAPFCARPARTSASRNARWPLRRLPSMACLRAARQGQILRGIQGGLAMALRFRHRIKIFPGVRLNLSARGMSLSLGPRGASVTLGSRGTYANLGIPGSGLSYRTRLHVPQVRKGLLNEHDNSSGLSSFDPPAPSDSPDDPVRAYEQLLRDLLRDREKGVVDWNERASWLDAPRPAEGDEEAFDAYAFKIAAARFAKRMVEGDKAAWSEVIREELLNEQLPFGFAFGWGIDESTGIIHVEIELPTTEAVAVTGLGTTKIRELYEDVCCALVLRFAYEIFRVIPEATDIYLSGYISSRDPATGHPARDIYLRVMVDRESFTNIDLDYVDPSSAFEGLGGSKRTRRGELVPIAVESQERQATDRAASEN